MDASRYILQVNGQSGVCWEKVCQAQYGKVELQQRQPVDVVLYFPYLVCWTRKEVEAMSTDS